MYKKKSLPERILRALIKALLIAAVLIIAALIISKAWTDYSEAVREHAEVTNAVTSSDAPISLYSPATEEPSADVLSASPTVEPTAAPTPRPEIHYDYLPVYDRIDTEEKKIVITVDDLSQAVELERITAAAETGDYKLTLFPSGVALENEYACKLLKKCASVYGYEVENRGYGSRVLYRLSNEDLIAQIWDMEVSVNAAMGGNYTMHFFRPYGALGTKDQRLHNYLKQLGYDAIVTWTVNAGLTDLTGLMDGIAPGNIYVFSSTTEEVDKMFSFIKFAKSLGYEIMTLNEMLDYPENELSDFDASYLFAKQPELEETEWVLETIETGDSSYRVYMIQQRLAELGYLTDADVDGVFGTGTASAVANFEVRCGMIGTGICDADFQEKLFSDDAPRAD